MDDGFFRFYASEVSYFSAKVRPALRYKRIPHVELLATSAAYRDVIRPRTGLNMIPVVVTPEDETLQDSSDILDALEARVPRPPLYPSTPVQRVVAYLIELYSRCTTRLPRRGARRWMPRSPAPDWRCCCSFDRAIASASGTSSWSLRSEAV
jgi:glutathione S-transferase